MSLWVAKQEFQQRYKLAEHVPQELAKELAKAAKAAKDQGDPLQTLRLLRKKLPCVKLLHTKGRCFHNVF